MDKLRLAEIEIDLRESNFTVDEIAALEAERMQSRSWGYAVAQLLQYAKYGNFRDIATFVQQVEFFWRLKGNQPFFKYLSPCSGCKEGDSWEEDLLMSYSELYSILKVVSTSVQGKRNAEQLARNGTTLNTLVVRYKNSHGVTFWYLNERLLLNLRAYSKAKFGNAAILVNDKKGHSCNSEESYISEPLTEPLIEKENLIKEKESSWEELEAMSNVVTSRKRGSSEKVKNERKAKANKKTVRTELQQKLYEDQKHGIVIPLDFKPDKSIMGQLVEAGYLLEELESSAKTFYDYYHNKKTGDKCRDWGERFRDFWVERDNSLTKNGKKPTTANNQRVERLRELATGSVFDRVGTTDFSELGKRIRQRSSDSDGEYNSS